MPKTGFLMTRLILYLKYYEMCILFVPVADGMYQMSMMVDPDETAPLGLLLVQSKQGLHSILGLV